MNRLPLLVVACGLSLLTGAHAAVVGHSVDYRAADGTHLRGYVAYDNRFKTPRPTILVFHDWDGIDGYEQGRCRQLAGLGYVAFAPDIYGVGTKVATVAEKSADFGKYAGNLKLYRSRIKSGYDEMLLQKFVNPKQVVAIGYCFGGGSALEAARSGLPLKGVVTFHGSLSTTQPMKKGVFAGRILVLHGQDDPLVPPSAVAGLQKEMKAAGVPVSVVMYPGAQHAFTVPNADKQGVKGVAYNAHADAKSWIALVKFLRGTIH